MLIFDLDGTLIDSTGVWVDVDKIFLARRGVEYSKEYYEGVAHTILQNCATFTKEFLNLEESCEEIIAEWMELAKDAYDHVPLKPGAREYLEQCKAEGERMILLTACVPEHCRTALKRHDLEPYFERLILAQELNMDKKSPEVFLQVAEMMGVKPEDCVLYDDSIAACKSAKQAGLKTVGVFDEHCSENKAELRMICDAFIMSFEDLLK
ncbi:MAG: HAD family phosphatase [Firmicutes bacterium]|nr:HAD family phosphatase [Bacillota bacterium]